MKFWGGKLTKINKKSFKNASKLHSFEMHAVKVDEISPNAFEGAEELTEISLENCDIGKIDKNAFVGLNKLKTIRLTGSNYNDNEFMKNLPESVVNIELKI